MTTKSSPRAKLLQVLTDMPDEAFGWFVMWASVGSPHGSMAQQQQARQIFPDGIGGFTDESRKSIDALRKAAKKFMRATVQEYKP